jgi:hypothetical protein
MMFERLTYGHAALRKTVFFLDQLLARMPPPADLNRPTSQKPDIGSMSRLPAELILDILERLSVSDLIRFRRCNRAANYYVDSKTLLHSALRFAPNVLQGIMAIQPSMSITAHHLREKLSQRCCDACGHLAQYIYLPTCSRACFECLPQFGCRTFGVPIPEWEMTKQVQLGPRDIAAVPSFRLLPAVFTCGVNKFKTASSPRLYDVATAWARHDDKYETAPCPRYPEAVWPEWQELLDIDCALDSPQKDIIVLDNHSVEGIRLHMCVVFAPWTDSGSTTSEEGRFCAVCMYTEQGRKLYTKESFLEHIKDCRVRPFDRAKLRGEDQYFIVDENEASVTM